MQKGLGNQVKNTFLYANSHLGASKEAMKVLKAKI